jgi:hypothetical protein
MAQKEQVSSNKGSYQNSQTTQKKNQESQIHGTAGGEMPDAEHLNSNQDQQKPVRNR